MILGVCGMAGSGKDTVADILVKEHGFAKVALADAMKRFLFRDVFHFTEEQLWGPSEARNALDKRFPREHGPWTKDGYCGCCGIENDSDMPRVQCYLTPRYALQQLGTEWGRAMYENVWIDEVIRTAEFLLEKPGGDYHRRVGPARMTKFAGEGDDRRIEEDTSVMVKGVVVSDVRYPNEATAIRKAGGRIWRTVHGQGLKGAAGTHTSETLVHSVEVDALVPDSKLEALPGIIAEMLAAR